MPVVHDNPTVDQEGSVGKCFRSIHHRHRSIHSHAAQTFLTLCAIQKQNGSAANATEFAPLVYVTNTDPTISGAVKSAAGATAGASHSSAAWATSAPAVGAAAFGALTGLSLLAASALFVL